ncbi:MAG: hypothetical protein AABX89_06160 [Candidatus Thermoplasmatota archaeon]
MRSLALVLVALAFAAAPATALPAASVVPLIHHPLDQVDPFGVSFGGADSFSARYRAVAAQTGRFDFPLFLADGRDPVQQLPDPARPYEGTLEAYQVALQARSGSMAPVSLAITATANGGNADVELKITPRGSVELQGSSLRLFVAITEDALHFQPPPEISNGLTDHRFVVRRLLDAGPVNLTATTRTLTLPLESSWQQDRVAVAAWLQAGPTEGRFKPSEVLQAISAPLDGVERVQEGRGVLLELYSATWCDPCLYGDLALEAIVVQAGAAEPLVPVRTSYWLAPDQPTLVLAASLAAGATAFALARRRA